MRSLLENSVHHVRETITLFATNKVSNLLSLLSTALVFLFLGMILVGFRASSYWVTLIRAEAEIQVFVRNDDTEGQLEKVLEELNKLTGVEQVAAIDSDTARERMSQLLGGEAGILSHLEENPFRPFLEVRISLDTLDTVLAQIEGLPQVETVRDNRDVLESLIRIESALRAAGLIFGGAVSLFTLVLLSHITRVGVVHNREQIRTLRLLGAPEGHIACPFLLLGLIFGAGGGIIASLVLGIGLRMLTATGNSPIPFLPIPSTAALLYGTIAVLGVAGALLGLLGTLSGLYSSRIRKKGHDLP